MFVQILTDFDLPSFSFGWLVGQAWWLNALELIGRIPTRVYHLIAGGCSRDKCFNSELNVDVRRV